MIKFNNQVPSVYPSASRDFQYFSWLIDIVLNAVKHNVDDIYNLPNNKADHKLTELLAMTLGFKVKRNYDQAQLRSLIAALPRILKYKGTKTAIDMAGNALIAASGAAGDFDSTIEDGELIVTFPDSLIDISLFTDLLDYILPAGMTCRIVKQNQEKHDYATEFEFGYGETWQATWVPDLDWDSNNNIATGLSSIYDVAEVGTTKPLTFANHYNADGKDKPNIGLLNNSIIPTIPKNALSNSSSFLTEANDSGATLIIDSSDTTNENADGTTVVIDA